MSLGKQRHAEKSTLICRFVLTFNRRSKQGSPLDRILHFTETFVEQCEKKAGIVV